MTTRNEQKSQFLGKFNEIKGKIADIFQTKYIEFFFAPNGKLDPVVGMTLVIVATLATIIFVSPAPEIVLTVYALSVMLFLIVRWKSLVLKALGHFPLKEKK